MSGDAVPQIDGAPAVVDGAPVSGDREIGADDLVMVKVRYKAVDAAESDPANEVSRTLTDAETGDGLADMDADFRWAASVVRFAEVLKESPYITPSAVDDVAEIIESSTWEAYPDRQEFLVLFDQAVALLPQ